MLTAGGAPGLAFSVHPHGNQRFNPLTLVAGNWPSGAGEVGIDDNTAERHGYRVGQTIGVVARGAEQQMRIAGIVKIGGVASLGGATMAIFDFPVAQRLFNLEGRLSSISIAVAPGYTRAQVLREIRPLLPPNAEARTGTSQAKKATHDTSGFLEHHPELPAGLRGHRAVRRQLRDRQHAVDHDRPAHAGAGHAAHARGHAGARSCAP